MHFLLNTSFSLDIIAMALSIGIVVWSFQIKTGNVLAKIGGTLLFILSLLSLISTCYYASKMALHHEALLKEHKMIENIMHEGEKAPQ